MLRISHIAAPAVVAAALFVGGCTNEHQQLPGNAQLMGESRENVAATAPHDGTVYIYDSSAHKEIYTGRVLKGDNVQLDAKQNRVMLNDRVALQQSLHDNDLYQIYFDRNENSDAINASHREGAAAQPYNGQPNNGATTYQPNGQPATAAPAQQQPANTTVIPPAPANNYNHNGYNSTPNNSTPNSSTPNSSTPPNNGATVVQPNGTVVQPSPNGGTTVTTPNGNRTTVEQR